LKAGALNAVLMFLDFFPSGTQRSALTTAANICRQISPDSFENVVDAIPILTNLLQYQDAKLVEKTIICFSRLADCLHGTDKLEELTKFGLVPNIVRLIASNSGFLSPSTYTLLIRLLTSMCIGSPAIVRTLLQDGEGVISVIQNVLASGSSSDGISFFSFLSNFCSINNLT
jgi:E3 ubiquitin-protein ligase TRIP12